MVIYEHVKGMISIPVYNENGDYAGYTNDIAFTENDIIKDSCSITSRACDDTTFSLGGVRPAELSIKLKLEGSGINAYNLYGAKIILYSCYAQHPKESDWVLRGIFWVTSVSRVKSMYTLRASDALVWLNNGSYANENGKLDIDSNPVYHSLSTAIRTIGGAFGTILDISNIELTALGQETIRHYELPEVWSPTGIFLNNSPPYPSPVSAWTVLGKEESTYSSAVKSPSDYAKMLAELQAGFVKVRDGHGKQIMICPFGYHNATEGYDTLCISHSEITQDSCDIAGYTLFFQNVYIETYDGTKWSTYYTPSPYKGNLTIDLSGNAFMDGRWRQILLLDEQTQTLHQDNPDANTFYPLNHIAEHLRSLPFRPFQLKCHKTFIGLENYPKLGQQIEIEEADGKKKRSILTKIIWKFRGGWEFGCAGSDSRVLSQAAKKSLASHAEEAAKTYATIAAANARNVAQAAWDYADAAQENANSRLDINDWDTIQSQIEDLWNAVNNR